MAQLAPWICVLSLFFTLASMSRAQDNSCLNQLIPCLQYINSKKTPSSSCCDPLKSLIRSDPRCLCSMLGGNSAAKQAGVNATQALLLPARCGEKVKAAMCSSTSNKKMKQSSSGADFLTANGVMGCLLLIIQIVWVSII